MDINHHLHFHFVSCRLSGEMFITLFQADYTKPNHQFNLRDIDILMHSTHTDIIMCDNSAAATFTIDQALRSVCRQSFYISNRKLCHCGIVMFDFPSFNFCFVLWVTIIII